MTHARLDIGPFGIVPLWVLERLSGNPRAVVLYAHLAVMADRDTGAAWPSRRLLAERMGISTDTVDRVVASLIEAGALTVEARMNDSGDRTSNLYLVHTIDPQGVAARMRLPGRTDAATGGRTGAALTRTSINQNPPTPPEGGTARVASPRRRTTADPLTEAERGPEFDRWYAAYPRRVGKLDAVRAWRQMLRTIPADVDELIRSSIAMGQTIMREHPGDADWKRYVPHPATWLRAGRWEDEIEAGATGPAIIPVCAVCATSDPCNNPCGGPAVREEFDPEEECPWRR